MSSSSKDIIPMSAEDLYDRLYIPFDEIKSAINNYADENLIKQGTLCKLYKGQLLQSGQLIDIVVHKYPLSVMQRHMAFSVFHRHKYIVPVFKFSCLPDDEGLLVYKHEANGSLDKHLSSPTLTWLRRLNICVVVAHALKHLHYDANVNGYVIHGNIKSLKILLDHNWEPKLHGFGSGVLAQKNQVYLISKYTGSLQYMDPAYEKTGCLTHKSDIFSFGVVLFGRKASIQNNDNWYFARLARSHYEEGKLDDLVDPGLLKQMNMQSFNIFVETAYYCLKELRTERPDMNQVLSKLEKALELQQQHEHATTAKCASPSNHLKEKSLDHLKFRLSDLELATDNFSESYCIGSGGYGKVYKAKLDHLNEISSLVVEGKNKDRLPKRYGTVAVKRIFNRNDGQGEHGFFTEIEMLINCKHQNIVSLQGFCDEGPDMILVYEYVSNGSLAEYLGNAAKMINLTWTQRIQICLDIAHGLNYLHTCTNEKQCIIHRDIKSDNILLDDKWVAKIADFGLSKLHIAYQQGSTLITNNIAGTNVYLDPEYVRTGRLKTKSDVYSFEVVMFEIMCGKLAYDETYKEKGLPALARDCFDEGILKYLVDPKLMEADENISMLVGGVNQDSLYTFSKVAYQCLEEIQSVRPTLEVVIEELAKALNFQKNSKHNLHISLKDIKLGTCDFSDYNCNKEGRLWKLYEGKFGHANGFAKRWDNMSRQAYFQFLREIEVLVKHNHKNIIGSQEHHWSCRLLQ